MKINIKENLLNFMRERNISEENVQLPEAVIETDNIRVIMISEVPPYDPDDYFYSRAGNADYMKSTLSLFRDAGVSIKDIDDILQMGIYITTAVKSPKQGYAVDAEKISEHLPVLEHEIEMFPKVKVIMLMGDVAKKSFNLIARKKTKKNAIPSGSTYKIRSGEFYFENIRIFPSYIMTGGNILIEKSKRMMISDDISHMMNIIENK